MIDQNLFSRGVYFSHDILQRYIIDLFRIGSVLKSKVYFLYTYYNFLFLTFAYIA